MTSKLNSILERAPNNIIMPELNVDEVWHEALPDDKRPRIYTDDNLASDGFAPLTEAEDFTSDMSKRTSLQLFAMSLNNRIALKAAQAEYYSLSEQIAELKGSNGPAKNPQNLLDADEFEERKEAALYGYKYEVPKPCLFHNGVAGLRTVDDISEQEKHDVRFLPEPFSQGGFVPNDRQYRGMLARAKNRNNIDGWTPVNKGRKSLIPVQQIPKEEYTMTYVRRNVDENGEIIRPVSPDSEDSLATPTKAVDKRLTRTRFGGRKVPPTRDVSETPSVSSTPGKRRAATPLLDTRESTPALKRLKTNAALPLKPDRPKHANQYTKAREAAARGATQTGAAAVPTAPQQMPDWSSMPPQQLRARKWTDEELIDSLKKDHSWLHEDPAKALEWKDKILNGINPVRSWSMVKKWAEWRRENKDKRPRKKELTPGIGHENGYSPAPSGMGTADDARWERGGTEEFWVMTDSPRRSTRNR